jgi:hypothetical protein
MSINCEYPGRTPSPWQVTTCPVIPQEKPLLAWSLLKSSAPTGTMPLGRVSTMVTSPLGTSEPTLVAIRRMLPCSLEPGTRLVGCEETASFQTGAGLALAVAERPKSKQAPSETTVISRPMPFIYLLLLCL